MRLPNATDGRERKTILTNRSAGARGSRARFLAMAVLAASALLLDAGAAAAAINPGGYTIRTKVITVPGNTPGTGGGKVTCPQGMRVVTGGAYWHRPGEGSTDALGAYLGASAPTANGRAWMASGIHWEGGDLNLEIVAYCLPASSVGTYAARTSDVTVDGKQAGVAEAACASGNRLVTGGYYWHRAGQPWDKNLEVYARSAFPRPAGTSWYTSAWNDGAEALVLTSVALCRPSASVGTYSVRKVDVSLPDEAPPANQGSGTPACASGRRAVPGGAYWHRDGYGVDPDLVGWLKGSAPLNGGRRWYASGQNDDNEVIEMRVLLLCLPT
jgi:hypothetical protein